MPRIRPAEIIFKSNKRRRVLQQMEGFAIKDGLLTIYTMERGIKDVEVKLWYGKTEVQKQQCLNEIPIKAYPVEDIDCIDFGYGTMEEAKARYEMAKKEEEERLAYEAIKAKEEAKE